MINGYLMDMEFYSKDMPYGGLEFAITEIISLLKNEGCNMFSLGGTYGPEIEKSLNADTEVREILEQIRKTNDFSQGNLQFKNKFRTVNTTIYLCKPLGGDASNVLDILMMIADPETESESISSEVSDKNNELLNGGMNTLSRLEKLEEAGFNPALISDEDIDCDLLTDSWLQLKTDYVINRQKHLIAGTVESDSNINTLLTEIFGFKNIIAVNSGRQAESILCESWRSEKVDIVQNLLFPTWIFTQIEKGFNPVELPNANIFSLNSKEMFRGGLEVQKVQEYFDQHIDQVGMLCVELANNLFNVMKINIVICLFGKLQKSYVIMLIVLQEAWARIFACLLEA